MSSELNVMQQLIGRGIRDAERSFAIADVDEPGCGVIPDIVRVIDPSQCGSELLRSGIECAEGAVVAISETETMRLDQRERAGRLMQTSKRMQVLELRDVEEFSSVVA